MGRPEWAETGPYNNNKSRVANVAHLDRLIGERFMKDSTGDMAAALLAAGIAFGRVNSVAGLSSHRDLRRASIETPSGLVEIPAPPARFAGEDNLALGPVPATGEHNNLIRSEFAG